MKQTKRKWVFYVSFFLLGVILFFIKKKMYLGEESVLAYDNLQRLANRSVDPKEYVIYLLTYRIPILVAIMIASDKGKSVFMWFASLFCFFYGIIVTENVIRYGIGGVLLSIILIFPQIILYYVSFFIILHREKNEKTNRKRKKVHRIIRLMIGVGIYVIGVFVEGVWNEKIVIQTIFLL